MGYDGTCVENKTCGDGFKSVIAASGISHNDWHHLEFELEAINTDFADVWNYWLDDKHIHSGGAYLNAYFLTENQQYYNINRLKFKPKHAVNDDHYQGFYFDDIFYKCFQTADRDILLDSYSTGFEMS